MLKRFVLFAALAASLALTACKPKSAATASAASGGKPGSTQQIFRFGNHAEPQDLDSQTVTGIPEHHIIMALFEGLCGEDPHDLHPVPGQAESWEISPDGLVYTFHLRPNLKWSNGDPLTADDFVQSYRRMLSPGLGSEYSYLLWFVVGAEDYNRQKLTDFSKVGFKALDDRTLQVTLKNPTPYLLKIIANHYAWNPVPVKVIAKFGPVDQRRSPWTLPGNLVSNGPFMLKEWTPHQKVVVVRNPNYWDAANVKLDAVEFYPVDDLAAEERMFRTGQLDKTQELPISKIVAYRNEKSPFLRIEPYLGVYFYRCNVTKPPLNDVRVRKALAMAIDRQLLVDRVTRADERPAYAVSYPDDAGYTPRAHLTENVAEAKRLLAEAGYPDGKGFPHTELLYNTQENHRLIAEAVQAMWRKNLGIDIDLVNQEWKVYLDTQHETHNFQLQRAGWIADYVDPHVFLEIWTTGNGNNDTLWSNADYDRLYQEALAAKNDQDRYEIYQKMDQILVDEMPVIPLYYYTRPYAISPRVKGYWPTLLDNHPFKYIYLED